MATMAWSVVNLGRFRDKAKTLPQIIFEDPDWFFRTIETKAFQSLGANLVAEAADLEQKAKAIRIPNNEDGGLVAEYVNHPWGDGFSEMRLVAIDHPVPDGPSPTYRKKIIDLSFPRKFKGPKALMRTSDR